MKHSIRMRDIVFALLLALVMVASGCGNVFLDNDDENVEGSNIIEQIPQESEPAESATAESALSETAPTETTTEDQYTSDGILTSTDDINLTSTDDKGKNYTFTYDGMEYQAVYTTDHWKIKDSYNITNESDMMIICQALIDLHPIHGYDMVSYRTADDMVYEWEVHNFAYAILSDDDSMKSHARDVDFDPEDQGRSIDEIYEAHTGKEFDINQILGR